MNLKRKFAAARDKIKNYAPEITGAGIVVSTAVITLVLKNLLESKDDILRVKTDDQEWMIQEDTSITYSAGGNDYSVRYLGKTPPNC